MKNTLIDDQLIGLIIKKACNRDLGGPEMNTNCWKECFAYLKKNPIVISLIINGSSYFSSYDEWEQGEGNQAINIDYIGIFKGTDELVRFENGRETL